MESRSRNWGKGRSRAASKRRKKRALAERYEHDAGHTRDGHVVRPLTGRFTSTSISGRVDTGPELQNVLPPGSAGHSRFVSVDHPTGVMSRDFAAGIARGLNTQTKRRNE